MVMHIEGSAPKRDKTRKPTHPGKFFEHMYLEGHAENDGKSIEVLALKMSIPVTDLDQFIRGQSRCGNSLAKRIADCTGSRVRFWLNLQLELDVWEASRTTFINPIGKI